MVPAWVMTHGSPCTIRHPSMPSCACYHCQDLVFLLSLLGSFSPCVRRMGFLCRRFEQRLVTNWRQVQLNAAWQRLYSQTDEAMQVAFCPGTLNRAVASVLKACMHWQHCVNFDWAFTVTPICT